MLSMYKANKGVVVVVSIVRIMFKVSSKYKDMHHIERHRFDSVP